MATAKSQAGRGVFYHRDSKGKQEQGPQGYFRWACEEAQKRNLVLEGTAADVDWLIEHGGGHIHDVYIDYGVEGNKLSRPELDALRERIASDPGVTHLFVNHSDRLARPDAAADGVQLERSIRESVTIVYATGEMPRLMVGEREELGAQISTLVTMDRNGRFRDEHALKMNRSRLELALKGYSAGGRAPYGFRRALFHGDALVRYLDDGEIVQKRDHHVRWVLGSDDQIAVIGRILDLLPGRSGGEVARIFNEERIPAPDAGRIRKKHGVVREASGRWNSNTILAIARHPLVRGLMTNGRRSVGDRARFSANGPRPLGPQDRKEGAKVRSVKNDPSQIVVVRVKDRLISDADAAALDEILLKRSESQRGKPRSRTPGRNILGARVFDLNCTWPMYGQPRGKTYHYLCGLYQQSSGSDCTCNHINGEQAAQFVMSSIRQRVLNPRMREKLCRAIERHAELATNTTSTDQTRKRLETELGKIENEISVVGKNLARSKSKVALSAIEHEYELLVAQQSQMEKDLKGLVAVAGNVRTAQELAAEAVGNIDRLDALASDSDNLPHVGELFRSLDVRLFLRFSKVQKTKYVKGVLSGGVLTFGAAKGPIEPYSGPTAKGAVAKSKKKTVQGELSFPRPEMRMLGKVKQAKACTPTCVRPSRIANERAG